MDQGTHKEDIFRIGSFTKFNELSLEIFRYQYHSNEIYRNYVDGIGTDISKVDCYTEIPFLPIDFFKTHQVYCEGQPEKYFCSSGTSGRNTSKHWFRDADLYEKSFSTAFEMFYGNPEQYVILALLPSYLEKSDSSLVYMIEHLIKSSRKKESGFYLYNHQDLMNRLLDNENAGIKTFLFGVTFALLDFAEGVHTPLKHTIIMETGGMKGRREELIREEVHQRLCDAFGVKSIHSEYGMTELFSQAYSKGSGYFRCPPWMKVLIRDTNDPFTLVSGGKTGGINIVDLANIHSCSFIATQDLGRIAGNGIFEVLGRFDYSDVRGCNLMVG